MTKAFGKEIEATDRASQRAFPLLLNLSVPCTLSISVCAPGGSDRDGGGAIFSLLHSLICLPTRLVSRVAISSPP